MKQIKILILANDTTFTYKHRKELIQALCLNKYKVVLVSRILDFQKEFEDFGCELIDINNNRRGTNPLKDVFLLYKYYKILRKEKPDVVLTFNIKPNIYGCMVCRFLNIPHIVNITGLGLAVEYPGVLQKITVFLYRFSLQKANIIFFQNKGNKKFFMMYGLVNKKTKTILIPGSGVNLQEYIPLPYNQTETINFLFVSRILKEKGIDLYLNVAKIIKNKYSNTNFYICGGCDDEKYTNIIKEADKNGFVKWFGEQRNIKSYLLQARCIIYPSYYPEGMNNFLLEAAASARPIITTNRTGCKETVENNKTGFVVAIRNEKALLKAVDKFINLSFEQQKLMGELGRQKIERKFDRKFVVNKYLEVIGNLFNEKKS